MNETSSQAASTAALLTSAVTDAAKAVINTTAEVLENAATGEYRLEWIENYSPLNF